ncbi:MAG: DUF6512 family protein [Pseudothermotoga sp.]
MKSLSKILLYVAIFSVLHFGYELTGLSVLKPFCGVDESVFEHIKMGFWAYLFVSIIEYFFVKRPLDSRNFWYSRIFSAIFVPWSIIIIWYILPAIFGHVESVVIELMWAFTVVFLSGLVGHLLEKNLERIAPTNSLRMVIILLFVVSVIFFVRFSFSKPSIDLFANPLLGD